MAATTGSDVRPLFVPAAFAPGSNPSKLHYGVAVVDVDGDGKEEFVVCGFNGPNLVLKWDSEKQQLVDISLSDPKVAPLQDPMGQAIGVGAADIDGDGVEEIYFLNTNQAYSGRKNYRDRIFKRGADGTWYDLLEDDDNAAARNPFAGRSVAVVDRFGNGRYSIYVSNYASGSPQGLIGAVKLIEMDEDASKAKGKLILKDAAKEAGVAAFTGGRGVAAGVGIARHLQPSSDGDSGATVRRASMDVLAVNERSPNFLYKNDGKGGFTEVAAEAGLSDKFEHGRGVALLDVDNSGRLGVAYGNWEGPHRLMVADPPAAASGDSTPRYRDIAPPEMADPTPIRTVLAADFDNDGSVEVFHNNIVYEGEQPNKMFRRRKEQKEGDSAAAGKWVRVDDAVLGKALEPDGYGTGGAYADIDHDGSLELLLSHGESMEQPLSFFRASEEARKRPVVQVLPLTQHGAPARGALVVAHWKDGKRQAHASDAGSGYLCQMTPVVHFGIGPAEGEGAEALLEKIEVVWPDGSRAAIKDSEIRANHRLIVPHPSLAAGKTVKESIPLK
jgi:ASPIC and UnbV/FG-GAP-like repeat